MTHSSLLHITRSELTPRDLAESNGNVFAVFDSRTQTSGNIAYGVNLGDRKLFLKYANPEADVYLNWDARVDMLRSAVTFAEECNHHCLPTLHNVIETPQGPVLVYQWVDGELLGGINRTEANSGHNKFLVLPVEEILDVLDTVFDLHAHLCAEKRTAIDFYDASLIYNFESKTIHVIDLDNYRSGPFQNEMGRMFGSTRFMAPEEFEKGEWITEQTTLFTMGRLAMVFLAAGGTGYSEFRGSRELFDVIDCACQPVKQNRYKTMRDFYAAWRAAR